MVSQRFTVHLILSVIFVICQTGIPSVNSLEEFIIDCLDEDGLSITTPKFKTPDASIYYSRVEVIFCHTPSTVYTDLLQSIHLKMPRKFKTYLPDGSIIRPDQFKGLQVETLEVQYKGVNNIFNGDILTNLTTVKKFHLINAVLQALPQTTLTDVRLWNGKSEGEFGNCDNLEEIHLFQWNVTTIPENWLMHCTNLRYLSLREQDVKDVEKILAGTYSIKKLEISRCGLLLITPELFMAMKTGLKQLYLGINRIKNIRIGPSYPQLEYADFSYNEITDLEQVMTFMKKQNESLVHFTLKNNRLLDICSQDSAPINPVFTNRPFVKLLFPRQNTDMSSMLNPFKNYFNSMSMPKLKILIFAGTATSKLCMHSLQVPSLEFLDFSNTRITILEFYHLPLGTALYLREIKLEKTPIRTVNLQRNDFGLLIKHHQPIKLSGLNLTLDCDCANTWLARAVYFKLVIVEAYCKNEYKRLQQVPLEKLECDKYNCEGCVCRKSWEFKNVTAYCNGDQTKIPQEINLTTLIAPGNLIASFNATDLSKNLMKLDLRKNHIAKLERNVVEALFNVSERRMNFSGNPLVCDCDNVPLLEALRSHRHQVEDYENITCVDDGRGLDELDFEELCTKQLDSRIMIASSFLLGLCAALAIMMALYLKFEQRIKIFLYARGWCMWWISEEEVDANRPFDAFISFSHEDEDFVMETLLPELEQCGYKLCVHNRNWILGEWIPTQITRSIALSRRTIFVISKNFLESVWGLLEFRLAHLSTLQEGRNRIIMLLLEDVDDVKMDDELQGHLKNNTYVKWGQRWFWDNLKFSLPHRTKIGANVEMEDMNAPVMIGPTRQYT